MTMTNEPATNEPAEPAVPDLTGANQPPVELFDGLPISLIDSILGRWGHSDSEAPADPTAPDPGLVQPPATDTTPPVSDEEQEVLAPPAPPGGPVFTDPSIDFTAKVKLPDGSEHTIAEIEALIKGRQVDPPIPAYTPPVASQPPAAPAPPTPTFPPPLAPTLPPFTEEDLENPAIRAVVMVAAAQQQRLEEYNTRLEQLTTQAKQVQYQENAQIVSSAVTSFKTTYNIPDELMSTVSQRAGSLLESNLIATANRDPVTGTVTPNPFEAVSKSPSDAYWLVPEARQFEFERQSNARQAAITRQRKLNGVGGSSGSAPRSPAAHDLSTPDGQRQAALAEIAAAMGMNQEG